MASIRKRGNYWRAEVRRRGHYYSESFSRKAAAQVWAAQKELEVEAAWSGSVVGAYTLKDALERYAKDISPQRKGHRWEKIRLDKIGRDAIAGKKLGDLRAADFVEWREARLKQVAPASCLREFQLLRSVLDRARREWHWMAHKPLEDVSMPRKARPRDRLISEDETTKILLALDWVDGGPIVKKKQLVAAYFLLALETGMRLGEMCRIDFVGVHPDKNYLTLSDTKNSDDRHVPLSSAAVALLKKIELAGISVRSDVASAIFARARRTCGIADLKFHDTRHEAITRLAKKLDVLELARMVGHRDLRSLMIYYNETASEIAKKLD